MLLELYIYLVIFSPSLSSNNKPKEIKLDWIFSKSKEFVIIEIIYCM